MRSTIKWPGKKSVSWRCVDLDTTSQKLEERVFQKRKEIQKAEAEIEQLKETMRAEEWLEQDLRQLERAEQEALEILRQG